MANFPADPDSETVDAFPCWAIMPKASMDIVYSRLHGTEKSRHDMVVRLKKVDPKAWLAICRERACINMDVNKWLPLMRLMALECTADELKAACRLPTAQDEDDLDTARMVLRRAVAGTLEITDNDRVKAALALIKLGPKGSTDTTIKVVTGVPREETSPDSSADRVLPLQGDSRGRKASPASGGGGTEDPGDDGADGGSAEERGFVYGG